MSLHANLTQDLKTAQKNKDSRTVSVLRMVLASIKNKEIEKKSELTDEEVMGALNYAAKQRKESVEGFRKGGREELALNEEVELSIVSKYLPEQLSEEDINREIEKIIDEMNPVGVQDFGKVMGPLMVRLKGVADGGLVGALLKKKLQL